jgi:hypothetical protein
MVGVGTPAVATCECADGDGTNDAIVRTVATAKLRPAVIRKVDWVVFIDVKPRPEE